MLLACLCHLCGWSREEEEEHLMCPTDLPCICTVQNTNSDQVQVVIDCTYQAIFSVPDLSFFADHENIIITQFDLSHNRITYIQQFAFELPTGIVIQRLFLTNNNIRYIAGGAFGQLQSLQWLDLSGNKMQKLQHNVFQGLEEAEVYLELKDMGIKTFPALALRRLRKVITIDLNRNSITTLPDFLFDNFEKEGTLLELNLNNNNLSVIAPKAFHDSGNTTSISISKLNLKNNKIKDIHFLENPCSLVLDSHTMEVHLSENPLLCDCYFYSVVNTGFYTLSGTCAQPNDYKGLPVDVRRSQYYLEKLAPVYMSPQFATVGEKDCKYAIVPFDVSCTGYGTTPVPMPSQATYLSPSLASLTFIHVIIHRV